MAVLPSLFLDRATRSADLRARLVDATADALHRIPPLPNPARRARRGGSLAVPAGLQERSRWYVERYPVRRYQAVVMGDPHGAAAHLAVVLGVPWLPMPGRGQPPAAYRWFIDNALHPGAPVVLVTSAAKPDHPIRAAVAAVAQYAARSGHRPRLVGLPSSALSAAVAEMYRGWLRRAGKTGDRLVVECGPLLDPWHVLRAGLVPYWSPSAARRHCDAFGWWLAGGAAYSSIEILLQPPGTPRPDGDVDRWTGTARFATRFGSVEAGCRRAYPHRPLPARHASNVLRRYPFDLPVPPPLPVADALRALEPPEAARP